jgi:osmotically inducible protein OsmC
MATTRSATTTWHGSLLEGSGRVELESSGLGGFDVTWASRAEDPAGRTSPEELIGAAHSSCFSMALSSALAKAGNPPESLETTAEVTFQPGEGITGIALTVRGQVPGISAEAFQDAAEGAKKNCPVSKALTGTTITLDASLA